MRGRKQNLFFLLLRAWLPSGSGGARLLRAGTLVALVGLSLVFQGWSSFSVGSEAPCLASHQVQQLPASYPCVYKFPVNLQGIPAACMPTEFCTPEHVVWISPGGGGLHIAFGLCHAANSTCDSHTPSNTLWCKPQPASVLSHVASFLSSACPSSQPPAAA